MGTGLFNPRLTVIEKAHSDVHVDGLCFQFGVLGSAAKPGSTGTWAAGLSLLVLK